MCYSSFVSASVYRLGRLYFQLFVFVTICRIMQIMPYDRRGTLVFKWDVLYCRISTDRRVAQSLCDSRASCNLCIAFGTLLGVMPFELTKIFGTRKLDSWAVISHITDMNMWYGI